MSLPADIVDKFGQYFTNFLDFVKANVQTMYPDLAPAEQEKQVFRQYEAYHMRGLMMFSGATYYPNNTEPDWGKSIGCTFDFNFNGGNASFTDFVYVGKGYNSGNYVTDEEAQSMLSCVTDSPPEFYTAPGYDMSILVGGQGGMAELRGYANGNYDPSKVAMHYGNQTQAGRRYDVPSGVLWNTGVEYTTNEQNIITTIGASEYQLNPSAVWAGYVFGLKSYPYIGNIKDRSKITDFVNKINSTGQSVHNYNTTYVTPDGNSIEVYYGDNYTFTYIVDDEPVSYDDLKNALDIAINQINDDNDSDIPSAPPFTPPPPPPPPPPSDDDDIDDQTIGAGANLASIARLWLLTRQQLIDLHAAFTSAPANYDPLSSFIGVLGFGVQPIKVVGDSLPWTLNPINIRMTNGETWHTGVEAHIVDSQVSAFSFPDIHIKKRYNNFLDYSPYATHEIFIPMCGWLTLPDIAVDRTISVTYLPDLESMRCRAVVAVVDEDGDKCVIGVKDGIMGAEVPFSNLNHSVWLANLITNAADVAGEIVTGAIGAGFTKTNAKGGTYRPYEGFTIGMAGTLPGAVGNALLSGNVNRTHVVGSNGNRTGFSDGDCIMIKSTYHKIDKPDNYDHTIGKVCNKTGQLSEFHGFTVCDNPHIHISALDEEKEEIKRLLEEGVILPSGE